MDSKVTPPGTITPGGKRVIVIMGDKRLPITLAANASNMAFVRVAILVLCPVDAQGKIRIVKTEQVEGVEHIYVKIRPVLKP